MESDLKGSESADPDFTNSKASASPVPPENLASRSDVGSAARQITSAVIRVIVAPWRLAAVRKAAEFRRRATGSRHQVHYFHQVDDAYSHLAALTLERFCARYDVDLTVHLARGASGPNIPEPGLLAVLARSDCGAVAPHYGLEFPAEADEPSRQAIARAEEVLAAALPKGVGRFGEVAGEVGAALWSGDSQRLEAAASRFGAVDRASTDKVLDEGSAARSERGHYSGAMFYYGGEWYWGVDRLHHLERRLMELGADSRPGGLLFPRPDVVKDPVARAGEMVLEVFPSLRSPYTAISYAHVVELAERTGVKLVTRPVLPMVMRGVPVTFQKGKYIMTDTAREAFTHGAPFGRVIDPIGEPVRRGYSLWPWANAAGKGEAFIAGFLRAAWAEGVNTGTDAGLRTVVESVGLSWDEALEHLGDSAWETELEANRLEMVEGMGVWGVPSFRLRGPNGEAELRCWGQDRLWLVAAEIARRGRAI